MPIRANSLSEALSPGRFTVNGNNLEIGSFTNPFGGGSFALTLIGATSSATISSISLIDSVTGKIVFNDINKKNMFFVEQFLIVNDYTISNAILDAKNFSMMLPLPSSFIINILYGGVPVVPTADSVIVITGI